VDLRPSFGKVASWLVLAVGLLLVVGCTKRVSPQRLTPSAVTSQTTKPAPITKITLLQMNDVYEITPVNNGKLGGLARVATLRKQLLKENPNTYTLLAGDLFSPSALGTAKVNGERLDGKQIVDVMNTLGLDYMTLGNHEFDVSQKAFENRIKESRFKIISSNVFSPDGKLFSGVLENHIFTVEDKVNGPVRIGLFGVTLDSNKAAYVTYTKALETARKEVKALRDKVDVLIALTHLDYPSDLELARTTPGIDIILGGHEHENMQFWRGEPLTPIFKADANATSVYIHDLLYNQKDHSLKIRSRLEQVTAVFTDDLETANVVQKWVAIASEGFAKDGFQAQEVITETNIALDGLEASVRNRPTELTKIIANGMLHEAPGTELALFNGGLIRIDDVIPPGKITQYDVIRIMPFGGKIINIEMNGTLLKRVLDQSQKNKGMGGYLQTTPNVSLDATNKNWLLNDQPIYSDQTYKVAINDFLLTGKETGLDYLTPSNPNLRVVSESIDVRRALINELKRAFGPQN